MTNIQEIFTERDEWSEFIRQLKCLRLVDSGNTFEKAQIDDFDKTYHENKCAIASWSWKPSKYEYEEGVEWSYFLEDSSNPSDVRNSVWERAASYMRNQQVEYLWIDAECIEQNDEAKKERAMHEMDLLYHCGSHPFGILTRTIKKTDELRLLAEILRGDMLESEPSESTSEESLDSQLSGSTSEASLDSELSGSTSEESLDSKLSENIGEIFLKEEAIGRASEGIELLRKITSDRWWTRAWIYQENYRGAERMNLLMPHSPKLKELKAQHEDLFGDLEGELIINSIQFSEALTDLCSAFKRSTTRRDRRDRRDEIKKVDKILSKAGRYSAFLAKGSSMSPTLIADVGERRVGDYFDRIPIIANCCSYNLRPDKSALVTKRCSHSLVILASFLLNGEIFRFKPDSMLRGKKRASNLTVIKFIQRYAFDRFSPPFQKKELTFKKSCRFSWVSLEADGVHTSGHLWELCKRKIKIHPQQVEGLDTIQTLWALQRYIKKNEWFEDIDRWFQLAARLKEFLDDSSESAANKYMWEMAETVADALREERTVRLGYLCKSPTECGFSPPTAIFIDPDEGIEWGKNNSAYVFTSFRERKTSGGPGYSCDVDKHVSLQVDAKNTEGPLPELKAREWMHGLWFKTRDPRKVVFPLPKVLRKL